MKILVTDGNNRVSLAVVRSLGRAGHNVSVVEQERFCKGIPIAAASRYVKRWDVLPPLTDERSFIDSLAKVAESLDLLLPVSTNVLLAVARHRQLFEERGTIVPIPDIDTIRAANGKRSLMKIASSLAIPAPRTYTESSFDSATFPLVVKLADDEGLYLDPRSRYAIVRSREELEREYRRLDAIKGEPLVQEYIEGEGYGFSAVCDRGKTLVFFCHRRIREYPAAGGPSSLCVCVRDPKLEEYSMRLLDHLRWHGAAMVEFKKERRSGEYKLMELNPRFAGSLPLAEHAGVNLPDILVRRAKGLTVPGEPPGYATGRKLRFLFMDALAVKSALGTKGKFPAYLWGFLRDLFDPEIKDGILSCNDPRPGWEYVLQNVGITSHDENSCLPRHNEND